jgi:hypothetical protein
VKSIPQLSSFHPIHHPHPIAKMQLLSLFSLATFASAAAIESRDTCSYATPGQLAFSRQALVNAKIVPPTRAQFRPTGSYVNLEDTFDPRVAVSVKYGEKAVNFGNTFSPVGEHEMRMVRPGMSAKHLLYRNPQ